MPIGAAISGVAALGSAGIGALASSSASQAQVAAQQNALNSQNTNFNNALQFQQGAFNTAQTALNPFIQSGSSVLPTLQSLLTPGASQTATLSQLPGFQFQSQYGTMATTRPIDPVSERPTALETQAMRLARAIWPAPILTPTIVSTAVQRPNRIGIIT